MQEMLGTSFCANFGTRIEWNMFSIGIPITFVHKEMEIVLEEFLMTYIKCQYTIVC